MPEQPQKDPKTVTVTLKGPCVFEGVEYKAGHKIKCTPAQADYIAKHVQPPKSGE